MTERRECCGTCKYGSYDKTNGYVCVNDESDYVADFVEFNHVCDEWGGKEAMTVVSQKRDFVFDFDSHVITQRGEYIYLHIDGRDVEIGKYESHERAQEVLKDMIEMNVIEVAYYMPEV